MTQQLHTGSDRSIDGNQSHQTNNDELRISTMFAAASTPRSAATTTDQYHHKETIWRVIIDVISLIILLVATIISHYVAKPFTRGFFCSDTTIQYPYRENTIPTYAAVILSIGLPIIWMLITEISKRFYFQWYPKRPFLIRFEINSDRFYYISSFIRNLYILTVVFFYGYLATWLLTEIAKNFVGNLRPHFRAVCQPSFNCSAVTLPSQFNRYLQYDIDYTCENSDETAVREARRSFFSGHASSIFYGLAWLIMYIHVSWSWRHLGILAHLFQIGFAVLAFYIGYSRISDYYHHWYDVLVGGIVGSLVAFVVFRFILNWSHYTTRFLPYTATTQTSNNSYRSSATPYTYPSNTNQRIQYY